MDSGAYPKLMLGIRVPVLYAMPEMLDPGEERGDGGQEALVPFPGPFVHVEKSFPLFGRVSLSVQ